MSLWWQQEEKSGVKLKDNPGQFDVIAARLWRAVDDLRSAVADGTAADPKAALELADRMQAYAENVGDKDR